MDFFSVKKYLKSTWDTLFIISLICICAFSVYLRFLVFNSGIGLFTDEVQILLNCISRSYSQLFMPLDGSQCMPPLFIILTKFLYSAFGLNEKVLKGFVFCFSVLNIFLFLLLSFTVFKNKFAVIFANFAFCLSVPVIMYSWIVKQYQSDIFFCILIIFLTVKLKDHVFKYNEIFLLSFLSVTSILMSYTAAFILFSCLSVLFVYRFKNKLYSTDWFKKLLCFLIPLGLAAIALFIINCLPVLMDGSIPSCWGKRTENLDPDVFFLPRNIQNAKDLLTFLFVGDNSICNFGLVFACFALSFILMFFKEKFYFFLFLFPFVVAVILGMLFLYPLSLSRVSLYLIPITILIIAKVLDNADFKNLNLSALVFLILVIFCYQYGNYKDYLDLYKNFYRDFFYYMGLSRANSKEYLGYLYKTNITKDDYIVCDSGYASYKVIGFYDNGKRFDKEKIFDDGFVEENLKSISQLGRNNIIYFLIDDKNILEEFTEKNLSWMNKNCKIENVIKTEHGRIMKCRTATRYR